ncbi:hypothetical protein [Poseidonibacter ostreae]|uniref:Uncharacterized protein n=1 Tax=Poseidonibacter ostreae TaxID=2654171 RepID=A0A6L4WWC7_9BACT|nr:hypothetical protein [Poseidonibacter ostreae]KAB7891336.1 hypothetical protein GBG19_00435 [Poseidonibacter ostreae]
MPELKINMQDPRLLSFIALYNLIYQKRIVKSKFFCKNKEILVRRILKLLHGNNINVEDKNRDKHIEKLLSSYGTQKDNWRNLRVIGTDIHNLKVLVSIDYRLHVFNVDKISYSWFERYRISTPFAITRDRSTHSNKTEKLHCLYVSIDFDRKSKNGEPDYLNKSIVIDDEIPLGIHLGKEETFICNGLAKEYSRNDFSNASKKNYIV